MGQGDFIHHPRRVIYNELHLASIDYINMHMSGQSLRAQSRVSVNFSLLVASNIRIRPGQPYQNRGDVNRILTLGRLRRTNRATNRLRWVVGGLQSPRPT